MINYKQETVYLNVNIKLGQTKKRNAKCNNHIELQSPIIDQIDHNISISSCKNLKLVCGGLHS
ncbi:hypothetical protein DERF_011410 [Dermatophagoides farinae]|uniref:Uncharacterized protein n=1 Tax=Dermatophagoides farinae TaxID=6954 RepID=A0A922HS54_DERFA|nr:hypothetical protein DERF_011410 [Dermatophagoides farinae]